MAYGSAMQEKNIRSAPINDICTVDLKSRHTPVKIQAFSDVQKLDHSSSFKNFSYL